MQERKKTKCEICGKLISNSNMLRHIKRHEQHPETFLDSRYYRNENNEFVCRFCSRIFKTMKSISQHEIRCPDNPNRKAFNNLGYYTSLGHVAWNESLTKETDSRVAKMSASVKATMRRKVENGYKPYFSTNDYWTEERRNNRSTEKKTYYKSYPEKHPNRLLADNRDKMTYPEQVVFDWLINKEIEFESQYRYPFNNSFRYVDFYLPDYNLFIEVDGAEWHTDMERDVEKDKLALLDGISTLRISTKDNIVDCLDRWFNDL